LRTKHVACYTYERPHERINDHQRRRRPRSGATEAALLSGLQGTNQQQWPDEHTPCGATRSASDRIRKRLITGVTRQARGRVRALAKIS